MGALLPTSIGNTEESMLRPAPTLTATLAVLLALPLLLAAQEMPTFTGKGKLTEAIDGDVGAVFDIGKGITMLFPKGLPVGHSRLVTLERSRKGPKAKQIHKKFKKVGTALRFSGAFNAPGRPIILAITMKRAPKKKGSKLVLAMEIGVFCDDTNKRYKLKGSLCSGWQFTDARHDGTRIVAKLRSTGGMRMVFGLIPEESGAE